MAFANGGIIVSMAPHFVFLKGTNGNDKADIRENMITGWGKTIPTPALLTYYGPFPARRLYFCLYFSGALARYERNNQSD